MSDLRDLIAETLAGHRLRQHSLICACGQEFDYSGSVGDVFREHARHVADVLLAALGERVLPADTAEHRQYGRLQPFAQRIIPSSLPDPTHYRLVGPWRPVDTEDTGRPGTVKESRVAD